MEEFKEYVDNDDDYSSPERTEVTQILPIRLYCNHEGSERCNVYIKGKEGYNGTFTAETGQRADLRNQEFICKNHR